MTRVTLVADDDRVVVDAAAGGRIASAVLGGRERLVTAPPPHLPPADGAMQWGVYVMAPWAGRVAGAVLRWDDEEHRLPARGPHALHGVCHDAAWVVEGATSDLVVLTCDLGGVGWPLGGTVRHEVSLEPGRLRCRLTVTAGARSMPVSLGWHPCLARPGARTAVEPATGSPTAVAPVPPADSDPGRSADTDPGRPADTDPDRPGDTDPGRPGDSDPGRPAGSDPGRPADPDRGSSADTDPGSSADTDPGAGPGVHRGPPLREEEPDVRLRVGSSAVLVTDAMIPTGGRAPATGELDLRAGPALGERRLDHTYVAPTGAATVTWSDLVLDIGPDPSTHCIVVFTPPHEVCVEPQTAWPDAVRLEQEGVGDTGLVRLPPGGATTATMTWTWRRPEAP